MHQIMNDVICNNDLVRVSLYIYLDILGIQNFNLGELDQYF